MPIFEITMFVTDEQLREMQSALDDVHNNLPVVNSDLFLVLQDALDNAEKIHENIPDIPEERARDIAIALARPSMPKAGNCS